MKIEYAYYDISSNETEIKEQLLQAIKYPAEVISVLPPYVKLAKSLVLPSQKVSCPIDYPLGVLDLKSRLSSISSAIKNGAEIVEILLPVYPLCNRKYDKFREDIKNCLDLCLENNVELRYVLEYRIYTYELLYKVAQILLDLGISTVYPSSGYSLDEISDNILAAALINKKSPSINIICNGNIWNSGHVQMVQKAKLYGIKVFSIHSLDIITKNI
jgi:deoxyribose-phosphate aldolase